VIETGIARGGSVTLSTSVLALLELAEAIEDGRSFDPTRPKRRVVGIDIDIRPHNRATVEAHPFAAWITMIEGSSVASDVIDQVGRITAEYRRIVVLLDSNHTHEHVLSELQSYAPLVTPGSYCVVFDTIIEDMPADTYPDRPWGPGENPKTAARENLVNHHEFTVDQDLDSKLLTSVAP
jgi:cephalosporin hydroxylase